MTDLLKLIGVDRVQGEMMLFASYRSLYWTPHDPKTQMAYTLSAVFGASRPSTPLFAAIDVDVCRYRFHVVTRVHEAENDDNVPQPSDSLLLRYPSAFMMPHDQDKVPSIQLRRRRWILGHGCWVDAGSWVLRPTPPAHGIAHPRAGSALGSYCAQEKAEAEKSLL